VRGGKKVPPEKEGMVHFVGLVVLLAFMLVVAFADINRIVSGQSFLR
jgi:regulator of sigma E protease